MEIITVICNSFVVSIYFLEKNIKIANSIICLHALPPVEKRVFQGQAPFIFLFIS